MPSKTNRKSILIALSLVAIDQLAKLFVVRSSVNFNVNKGLPVLSNLEIGLPVYFVVAILLLVFLALAEKDLKLRLQSPLLLVAAGISSNLIDRFFRGGVIDFINIKIWPVFNLADCFIIVGLIWAIVLLLKKP